MHRSVSLALGALLSLGAAASAQEAAPPHQTFQLESSALGETRRLNVYLPPDYREGDSTRFPVIYMPDGGIEEDFPHVAATIDGAIRAGEMRPVILVGIENTQRRRDMTGPTSVGSDSTIAPRVGGSAAFRRFIADELMPSVRGRYRVNEETAIIGESLVGLFIVETFLLEPELFDTYIAFSPSLWWNAEALVRGAPERLRGRPALTARLYVSSADEENIAPAAARLAEVLRADGPAGLRWIYRPHPELTHATIYRAEEGPVLRELFGR